jgi:tetratricopeptide (TPR) repeat protein
MEISVFISHAHDEKILAEAWQKLLRGISGGLMDVWLSSDSSPTGGIPLGGPWREAVYERLRPAKFIIAIVSPKSLERPWILWECGVASGVNKERGIVPVVHKMAVSDLSGPLSAYQAYSGDDRNKVKEVCTRFLRETGVFFDTGIFDFCVDRYITEIASFIPARSVSPRVFELWTNRFQDLIARGRVNELPHLTDQFYLAIGGKRPVDVMIHELLSRAFVDGELYETALEEVDFALSLLPDDAILLHRKGLILISQNNYGDVESLLNLTYETHPELRNWPELAGLEGRLYRERHAIANNQNSLLKAIAAYTRAFETNPTETYPGGQAIVLAVMAGDDLTKDRLMPQVFELCKQRSSKPDGSYWADFQLGELYIIKDDLNQAFSSYQKGLQRNPKPSQFDCKSARSGLERTGKAKGCNITHILNLFPGD